MTDTEEKPEVQKEEAPKKPGHLKKHGGNYAKLIAAISALTAAVNGYLDLAKKNELVYQALASKVNNMAEELAHVKGQNQVMLIFLAQKYGMEDMLDEMGAAETPARAPASSMASAPAMHDEPEMDEPTPAGDEAVEAAESSPEAHTEVVVEAAPPPPPKPKPKAEKRVVVQAYQELPQNLDDLVQVQEQLQVQEE